MSPGDGANLIVDAANTRIAQQEFREIRCVRASKRLNRTRGKSEFARRLNAKRASSWKSENFALRKAESVHNLGPSRLGKRGGRVVTNASGVAMDASCVADERRELRTAKACGPGTPGLVPSPQEMTCGRR
jgi:hypothetical protein